MVQCAPSHSRFGRCARPSVRLEGRCGLARQPDRPMPLAVCAVCTSDLWSGLAEGWQRWRGMKRCTQARSSYASIANGLGGLERDDVVCGAVARSRRSMHKKTRTMTMAFACFLIPVCVACKHVMLQRSTALCAAAHLADISRVQGVTGTRHALCGVVT